MNNCKKTALSQPTSISKMGRRGAKARTVWVVALVACCISSSVPTKGALASSLATAGNETPKTTSQEDQLNDLEAMRLAAIAFRAAAKRIEPALVTIESFGGATAVEGKIGGIRRQGEGNSTGLLISNEGHIVTSTFHFLRPSPTITVVTSDGKRHVAKMLGKDETRKVCVLKIEPQPSIEIPTWVTSKEVEVGQWSISIGVGFGDRNPAISTGIISAKNRISGRAVQTDANISPANYGGPLVDLEGRVIGICVPLSPRSQNVSAGVEWYDSGIGFAVPLTDSPTLLDRLKAGETVSPGYVGITMEPANEDGSGVKIKTIADDSPAASAGLTVGDELQKVDEFEVQDLTQLQSLIRRYNQGDKVIFTIERDDKVLEVEVELGARPAS